MIHLDCPQGSSAWFQARSGKPTASEFDRLLTPKTLRLSTQSDAYLCRLVAEYLTGQVFEQETTVWMTEGLTREAQAVSYYELTTDQETSECGFCLTDDEQVGASPDRFVGEEGLLEVKNPMASTQVSYVLAGGLPSDYVIQVQGQLWVTNRRWVDFLSYYPGLPPLLIRVFPDPRYQDALSTALAEFCLKLDYAKSQLKELMP